MTDDEALRAVIVQAMVLRTIRDALRRREYHPDSVANELNEAQQTLGEAYRVLREALGLEDTQPITVKRG